MTTEYKSFHTGILRSIQFGWNEYEGNRYPQVVGRFEIVSSADPSNSLVGQHQTWFGSLSEEESQGKTQGKSAGLRGVGTTQALAQQAGARAPQQKLAAVAPRRHKGMAESLGEVIAVAGCSALGIAC